MISIIIVDDQDLIRAAVSDLLSLEDDFTVIGQAADGREGVEQAVQLRPDIVLMDIRMPRMDGIQAVAAITAEPQLTETKVIMLTTFEDDENVFHALQAGASGFLGKSTQRADLTAAIRTVHDGEALLSPRATSALIQKYLTTPQPTPPTTVPESLDQLTERETEVLRLVGRGLNNAHIAAKLFISALTAKTHVNRIMTKLHVHDRAQLVVVAYESGLLSPGALDK